MREKRAAEMIPTNKPLTVRQKAILDFIQQFLMEKEYPPSLREIRDWMGVASLKGVHDHISFIVKKGYLERSEGASRGIRLTERAKGLYGKVVSTPRTHGKALQRLKGLVEDYTRHVDMQGADTPEEGAQRVLDEVWAILSEAGME